MAAALVGGFLITAPPWKSLLVILKETIHGFLASFFHKALEEGMATYSSILAWRVPWTEEPGGLQSPGLQRVGDD